MGGPQTCDGWRGLKPAERDDGAEACIKLDGDRARPEKRWMVMEPRPGERWMMMEPRLLRRKKMMEPKLIGRWKMMELSL